MANYPSKIACFPFKVCRGLCCHLQAKLSNNIPLSNNITVSVDSELVLVFPGTGERQKPEIKVFFLVTLYYIKVLVFCLINMMFLSSQSLSDTLLQLMVAKTTLVIL